MRELVYASRLMKGWEVQEACKAFREQEAEIRRGQIYAANTKTSDHAGEPVGCFAVKHLA